MAREAIRRSCAFPGCLRRTESKGFRKDVQRFRKYCRKHRYRDARYTRTGKNIGGTSCSLCGWRGKCDRHRKDPKKGYVKSNVVVCCPNCHRANHGDGEFNQPQVYEKGVPPA